MVLKWQSGKRNISDGINAGLLNHNLADGSGFTTININDSPNMSTATTTIRATVMIASTLTAEEAVSTPELSEFAVAQALTSQSMDDMLSQARTTKSSLDSTDQLGGFTPSSAISSIESDASESSIQSVGDGKPQIPAQTTSHFMSTTNTIRVTQTTSVAVPSTSKGSSEASAHPSGDLSQDSHESSHGNTLAPVIGTIIPVVLIAMAIIVYLWWWRRKTKDGKERDDLEREAVWITKPIAAASPREVDNSNNTKLSIKSTNSTSADNSTDGNVPAPAAQRIRKSKKVSPLHLPSKLTTKPEDNGLNSQSDTTQLEDPFLTPTSQTTFSNHDDNEHDSEQFRTSQIGLAVTTPPTLALPQNSSVISLSDSIKTILHHASRRLSNPFENLNASRSDDSLIYPPPTANKFSSAIPEEDVHAQNTEDTERNSNEGQIPKSTTPPEDLARRWIEVLKMEAAQAQQAAAEAARKAKELKDKEIEGLKLGVNDRDRETIAEKDQDGGKGASAT